MVYKLSDGVITEKIGNKAKSLMQLKSTGFNVPDGIVLDSDAFDEILEFNNIADDIREIITSIVITNEEDNIKEVSTQIEKLLEELQLPDDIVCPINYNIKDGVKYAVRSSGIKEDMLGHSFAGQYDTYLDVEGRENVIEAIFKCYKSLYSVNVLRYLVDNKFNLDELKMAVVVQEMVDSTFSGVLFTVNPITGNDKEIIAEVIRGNGEKYVSGKINGSTYRYNWNEQKLECNDEEELVSEKLVKKLMLEALRMQAFYGYPCDVEFAINNNQIWFLQARPITKINYTEYDRVWTIANFKDGGVSSGACTAFMYSLYEYVWQYIMPKYLKEAKLVEPYDIPERLINMYFGRPYWDLTTVKGGASQAPGFKERDFDAMYSIKPNYEGDGKITEYTPATIMKGLKIVNAQKKIVEEFNKNAGKHCSKFERLFYEYDALLQEDLDVEEIEKHWISLINEHYFESETTYFWLVYVNTIEQAINKGFYLKYVDEIEYLSLLSGIDDVSHMRPFKLAWEISREIRSNLEEYAYWTSTNVKDIVRRINRNKDCMPRLEEFMNRFGYHSNREIDVTYPCYVEDLESVVTIIKEHVQLEDKYSPDNELKAQKEKYEAILNKVKEQLGKSKFEKFKIKSEKMRKMLWWREELKDISTRFYYLIRMFTLKLARKYVEMGVLVNENEVWHLSKDDIIAIAKKEISILELDEIIENNKTYYNSFKQFNCDCEIGLIDYDEMTYKSGTGIYGVGCNSGIVTAKARVIEDIKDIDKIRKGEILVTRFTDTGWTAKFAKLAGIVTEYGGVLCHTAIVSREYGIPCIVSAHDVMAKIKDGDKITINGTTGEIKIQK